MIATPSSTKNKDKSRGRQMHQTKKGNNYYHGMKAHIGVDAESGLVHTVTNNAANSHDVTQTTHPLQGQESDVYADSGYRGIEQREEAQDADLSWSPILGYAKVTQRQSSLISFASRDPS